MINTLSKQLDVFYKAIFLSALSILSGSVFSSDVTCPSTKRGFVIGKSNMDIVNTCLGTPTLGRLWEKGGYSYGYEVDLDTGTYFFYAFDQDGILVKMALISQKLNENDAENILANKDGFKDVAEMRKQEIADVNPMMVETGKSLSSNGVYKDVSRNLMWMRCSIGQRWSGYTCFGKPLTLSLEDAKKYQKLFNKEGFANMHDWRIPTVNELLTLRNCSKGWKYEMIGGLQGDIELSSIPFGKKQIDVPEKCSGDSSEPTINIDDFPNTPPDMAYITSSQDIRFNDSIYYISFKNGYVGSGKVNPLYLRLVRDDK